jgi:hypothetical protein
MAEATQSKTEIVREIVTKNPDATHGDHKEAMEKAGISAAYFSLIKGKLKGGSKPKAKKKAKPAPEVDLERAIEFVREAGGVEALKAKVAESQSYLAAVEKLLKECA